MEGWTARLPLYLRPQIWAACTCEDGQGVFPLLESVPDACVRANMVGMSILVAVITKRAKLLRQLLLKSATREILGMISPLLLRLAIRDKFLPIMLLLFSDQRMDPNDFMTMSDHQHGSVYAGEVACAEFFTAAYILRPEFLPPDVVAQILNFNTTCGCGTCQPQMRRSEIFPGLRKWSRSPLTESSRIIREFLLPPGSTSDPSVAPDTSYASDTSDAQIIPDLTDLESADSDDSRSPCTSVDDTRRLVAVILSGRLFALIVLHCDGFLRIAPSSAASGGARGRFFMMGSRLPLELQMMICKRALGLTSDVILSHDTENGIMSALRCV